MFTYVVSRGGGGVTISACVKQWVLARVLGRRGCDIGYGMAKRYRCVEIMDGMEYTVAQHGRRGVMLGA